VQRTGRPAQFEPARPLAGLLGEHEVERHIGLVEALDAIEVGIDELDGGHPPPADERRRLERGQLREVVQRLGPHIGVHGARSRPGDGRRRGDGAPGGHRRQEGAAAQRVHDVWGAG
jgi:hypothetical protein